eukprot:4516465-Amphidinium_carterae.2
MRAVLLWASKQDVDITDRDVELRFGLAASEADQVEDVNIVKADCWPAGGGSANKGAGGKGKP